MAEVTGQLGSEYIELNNAASEATLQALLKATIQNNKLNKVEAEKLQKEFDNLYNGSKSLSRETLQRASAERKTVQQTRLSQQVTAEFRKTEAEYKQEQKESANAIKKLGVDTLTTSNKIVDIAKSIADMGDSLTAATGMLSHIPIVGGLLSNSFGTIAANAEKLFGSFQSATAAGATFGGSITELVNAASGAGLTVDQFSKIIANNSEGIALLGAGVEDGARRFAALSKQMRTALLNEGLANLGYSTESANEGMAKYVSMLSRTGVAQNMTTQQLTTASTDYLKNLDSLSKLTGKSKDALQSEQDAMMNNAKLRSMLQGKDETTQKQAMRLISSLPKGMQAGAMEVLATGTATTEAGQKFLAYMSETGQDLVALGQNIRAGGKLTAEGTDSMIDAAAAEGKALAESPLGQTLAMFDESLNDFMVGAFDLAARTVSAEETRIATEKASQSTEQLALELVKAKQEIANFSNEVQKLLGNLLPALTSLVEKLNGPVGVALLGVVAAIKTFTLAMSAKKFVGALLDPTAAVGSPKDGLGKKGKTSRGLGKAAGGLGKLAAGAARFAGPVALIAAAGTAVYGAAKGVSKTAEIFELAENEVATGGQKVAAGIGGAISALSFGLLNSASVANVVHSAGASIGSAFESIASAYNKGITAVKDTFSSSLAPLKDFAGRLLENPEATMKELGDNITASFNSAKEFVSSMWSGMAESQLGEAISAGFNSAKEFVSSMWSGMAESQLGEAISAGFNSAKDFVSSAWSGAKEKMEEWGNSIKSGWSSLKGRVGSIFSSLRDRAGDTLSKVSEKLTGFLPSSADAKDAVASTFRSVVDKLNSAKELIMPGDTENTNQPASAVTGETTTAQPTVQSAMSELVNDLNTRVDTLIRLNTELILLSQQQLSVQRGLTTNLLE